MVTGDALKSLSIRSIAAIVRSDWKNVNYAAAPYLDAMFSLETVNDRFGFDDGKGIVNRFLGNARSYTGEQAKAIKAELKRRIK